ncbi:hypothetical protein ACS0TY_031295 [Phlomoides rotata]
MARISNGIITFLNILTLALSLCVIFVALLLYVKVESPCERAVRLPLLAVGGALLAVSLVGLIGSCCAISFFMWIYLITLFLLILALIAFTLFTILVTHKGIGDAFSGAGKTVGYHKLGEYSGWLQDHVVNDWEEIKSCMVKASLCGIIQGDEGVKRKLSPVQSGCCKPPNGCGGAAEQPDCKKWSMEPSQLCFNCESCKTSVLDNIRGEWRMLAIFNSCILLSITIIYSIGCCALRNNHQSHSYTKQRPNYY